MFTALLKYSGSSCSKSMVRVELQETQDYIQTFIFKYTENNMLKVTTLTSPILKNMEIERNVAFALSHSIIEDKFVLLS